MKKALLIALMCLLVGISKAQVDTTSIMYRPTPRAFVEGMAFEIPTMKKYSNKMYASWGCMMGSMVLTGIGTIFYTSGVKNEDKQGINPNYPKTMMGIGSTLYVMAGISFTFGFGFHLAALDVINKPTRIKIYSE